MSGDDARANGARGGAKGEERESGGGAARTDDRPKESAVSAMPASAGTPERRVHTTRVHLGRPQPLSRVNRVLCILGPGLITGAADDDPSGIGTYSQTGAAYGLRLLWPAIYLLPLMIATQEMCARIGLVTGQGLAGVLRRRYSRWALYGAVTLLFVANTINVGADLGAMAASTQLLVSWLPTTPLLVVFALGIIALEIFVPYQRYAQILKYLALSLLAYVVTGFIIGGDWRALLIATIAPSIEFTPSYLTLVAAFIGTTISPYLFFWQTSEEAEENEEFKSKVAETTEARRKTAIGLKLKVIRMDTIVGMLASEVTAWFIIQTTAGTLHAHKITNITTAAQAAQALVPFAHGLPYAGVIARTIFALGVVGTGLLAVPVLAGSAAYGVAEAFGWHEGLSRVFNQARGFYGVIALSTLLGLAFTLLGVNPIAALVLSAVINAVVAVPLLALILLIANNRTIMGDFTNGRLANTFGILTFIAMAAATIASLIFLIPGM